MQPLAPVFWTLKLAKIQAFRAAAARHHLHNKAEHKLLSLPVPFVIQAMMAGLTTGCNIMAPSPL